ncbi:replication protein A 70 kDa DNA-binding subunit [Haematococcus lacustris]
MAQLSKGCLAKVKAMDGFSDPIVLLVSSLQQKDDTKYRGTFSDGSDSIAVVLASQLTELAKNGTLRTGATVKVSSYTANSVPGQGTVLVVTELDVVSGSINDAVDVQIRTPSTSPECKSTVGAFRVKPDPDAKPQPSPSPSEEPANKYMKTPGGSVARSGPPASPSSVAPTISKRTKGFARIDQLHPYDDQWCIKAKLSRKYPLRTITARGGTRAVCTVELVDSEGHSIQGTFWGPQAERCSVTLDEGKVYVVERFTVKPANKQYSSLKNDYELVFSEKTEVCEAAEQAEAITMTALVDVVPIEQLPRYLTRKTNVDVMGVVTAVSGLGTVKRKSDSSELARRDVTLADKSGKTVTLTLWGENATCSIAESAAEGQVLQCTACRVTDFNGCSLNSSQRSALSLMPESKLARDLADWWSTGGQSATLTAVGADLAGARPSGAAGGSARNALSSMKEVTGQAVPEPDAKPVYHNVMATVALVQSEQSMYYLANPETGRKVVAQDGKFYSESDGKTCDAASHRYVMSIKAMDGTGDAYLNLFNDQAQLVVGKSADEVAELRSRDEDAYKALCRSLAWSEWACTISTKSRDYNGERKLRHTVMSVRPVDFVNDAQRLLDVIAKYTPVC